MLPILYDERLPKEKRDLLQAAATQLEPLMKKFQEEKQGPLICRINAPATPKVSVIIPVFNVEKYLFQSLSAILEQTCREIEVICVDDCSTDASWQILNFFALLDARVKVIRHEKNCFAGVARNTGMAAAKGEYLFFPDPDDWCETDLLENAVKSGDEFDSDVVILRGDMVDAKTGKFILSWGVSEALTEPFSRKSCPGNIFSVISPAPWNKIFRRDWVVREGLFFQDLQRVNDLFFSFSAMVSARRISYLKEGCFYHYRVNVAGSLQNTKNRSPLCLFKAFNSLKQRLDHVENRETLIVELQNFFYLSTLPYEIFNVPPRGDGFCEFYSYLHDRFCDEFGLIDCPPRGFPEIQAIMQAMKQNEHSCDFLQAMIRFYRPFLWQNTCLQDQLQQRDAVICQKDDVIRQKDDVIRQKDDVIRQKDDVIQKKNNAASRHKASIQHKQKELEQLRGSFSYRIGRFLTWPPRMMRAMFRCIREKGLVYAVRRAASKFTR